MRAARGSPRTTLACALGAVFLASGGCAATTAGQRGPGDAATVSEVTAFMETVAREVTRDGPLAWSRFFSTDPEFYMAVNGQRVFPSGAAASAAIAELPKALASVQLSWGTDLRVEVLAPDAATVGVSYAETRVTPKGERISDAGFFTGTVQRRAGRWLFHNAHWSLPLEPPSGDRKP